MSSKCIKVSVIIPVYNAQKYLENTLKCVLGQSLKEIEVICVDDGSTDSSPEILKRAAKSDSRVKIITQQNRYAGAARNAGMAAASGKYLVFWDADDLFDRGALRAMYQKCEKTSADICVSAARRMDCETGRVRFTRIYLNKKRIDAPEPFSKRSCGGAIFNFTTNVPWNKMFLRSFVEKNNLFFQELPQANDAYFVMTALFYAERICTVSRPLMTYREDNPKSTTGTASKNMTCVFEALKKTYERICADEGFNGEVRRSFANKALDSMLYSLRTQRSAEAYGRLFELYKGTALELFGISGHGADYIYEREKREELKLMESCGAYDFLLEKARRYERRYRLLSTDTAVRVIRLIKRIN